MKRVEGTKGVSLIECVNPIKDKWRIRWDVVVADDGSANYMEEEFIHRPEVAVIKSMVIGWYNQKIDEEILEGFSFENSMVYLSSENQFNYKVAYDLAVQTQGKSLPVTFKFGTDSSPVYRVFKDLDDITGFYTSAIAYIQNVLQKGWTKKDSIDFSQYNL